MHSDEIIKARIEAVLPILNEHQQRVYLAAEAKSYGWGGKTKIAELSSVSRKTITKGDREPQEEGNISKQDRIRKKGGGRKKLTDHDPKLLQTIEDIVSPHTLGNPMNPLIWTSKSLIS